MTCACATSTAKTGRSEYPVTGDPSLRVQLEGTPYASVEVPADNTMQQRVYVMAPRGSVPAAQARTDIRFWVEDLSNGDRVYKDSVFNGVGQ